MKAKIILTYYIKYVDDIGRTRTIIIESRDALSAYEAAVAAYDAIEAPGRRMLSKRPQAKIQ